MYNKKVLSKAVSNLGSAKAPAKKKDKIYTNKEALTPFVSMEGFKQGPPPVGTNYRILGDTLYNPTPYPIEAVSDNGIRKTLAPYDTTNTYFPGANHVDEYEMGGEDYYDDELTDDEIEELRRGGYIVEELPHAQFGMFDKWKSKHVDQTIADAEPQEGVQQLPEMFASGNDAKRKLHVNLLDKANALWDTVQGRKVWGEEGPKNYSIDELKKYVGNVKNYNEQAQKYERDRRMVQQGQLSTDVFAQRYRDNNWARFDQNTGRENYKGEYQNAVNEANERKEKNMGVTDAVLELTGAPSLSRIASDPLGTLKGVGQTVADVAASPYALVKSAWNYGTTGDVNLGKNPFTGQAYGSGLDEVMDVAAVLPGLGGVRAVTNPLVKSTIKGLRTESRVAPQLLSSEGLVDDAMRQTRTGFSDIDTPIISNNTPKTRPAQITNYNRKEGMYDVYDVNLANEIQPGRSLEDVQHKFKNLRKDLGISYPEHLLNKYLPGFARPIPLDQGKGLLFDPTTGRLFDSNTRYWLNREYGITPKIDELIEGSENWIAKNYGTHTYSSSNGTPGIKYLDESVQGSKPRTSLSDNSVALTTDDGFYTVGDLTKHDNDILNIRAERLAALQTPKGQERLKAFIQDNPHLQGKSPQRAFEIDPFVPTEHDVMNGLADMDNVSQSLIKQREQMELGRQLFKEGKITQEQYENGIKRLQYEIEKLDYNPNSGSMLSTLVNPQWGKSEISIGANLTPLDARIAGRHELGHYFQGNAPSHLDEELKGLTLKVDQPYVSQPQGTTSFLGSKMKGKPNYFENSKNYWLSGSKGAEKVPFLEEVRGAMLEQGIIKNLYDDVTPEMLENFYKTYHKVPSDYPLRVFDIMENTPENFKLMSSVINRMPAVIPAVGGAGAAGYMINQSTDQQSTEGLKRGGEKKYSRSLSAKNRLFVENKLTKKPKSKKKKIFDPKAKYFQDGGANQVECTDDGRCYETDQAQELLDKTHKTISTALDMDRYIGEQVWNGVPANKAWQSLGVRTADQITGDPNAFACANSATRGYEACDPQRVSDADTLSNARMKAAVAAGRTPFRKVAMYNNNDFLYGNNLKPGQLISFMGNGTNHMVKYFGDNWNGDQRAFMQSNGDPKDWSMFTNFGWFPNVPATVYEYAPHYDEIQRLEEQARTNPTYVPGTASVGTLPIKPAEAIATQDSERVLPAVTQDLGMRQFGGIPTLPLNQNRQVLRDWLYGSDIGMLQEADGGYMDLDLTDEEIADLRNRGYYIEE